MVAHTRPRCEKQVALLAAREGFGHELPLYTSIRRYRTQTKRFTKPLFPGYVFVAMPADRVNRVYQGDFVARIIPVGDEARFLVQLEAIRRLVNSGLELNPASLVKGTRVRIAGGPLHGVEGIVDDLKAPTGVIVSIDVIQQGVLVSLTLDQIEAIDAVGSR